MLGVGNKVPVATFIGREGDVAPEVDAEEPIDAEPTDDEFGASDAAVGGTEPAGREKREGYQPVKKPIAESTRIFRKLAK